MSLSQSKSSTVTGRTNMGGVGACRCGYGQRYNVRGNAKGRERNQQQVKGVHSSAVLYQTQS